LKVLWHKIMKKNEKIIVVIVGIILLSVILFQKFTQKEKQYIIVKHHTTVILRIDSNVDQEYIVHGDVGEMHIEVKNKKFRVSYVECPDKLCEKQGWQNMRDGVPIVCLPNRIIIERELLSS